MVGFPVHHQLPESTQTHAHRVSDAIQPSHPLSLPSPPAFNLSQHQGFFQWVQWVFSTFHIMWPKYSSFSFSISPSNEHPGLISFRMDWLDLLAVQGTPTPQFKKASILQPSAFFMIQFSHSYMTTWKTIALTRQTHVGKAMSLLFNTLSRLAIDFLLRNKCPLISWLQSPSAVIFEAWENKVCHCFPIYLPWNYGTRCHECHFFNVEF